jgi:ferredoxin
VEENGDRLTVTTLYETAELDRKDALAERCQNCKSHFHPVYDEILGEEGEKKESARFDAVEALEQMTPEERFLFWQNELSRCIRCNACRNVCPACTCEKCVFDNPASGIASKAPASSFEEQNFHIIRAFHVAGRCTDCGECSRVCPQSIPLHLLNRKFIKDINELYGEYQAGENPEEKAPLNQFDLDDAEPDIVSKKGESR